MYGMCDRGEWVSRTIELKLQNEKKQVGNKIGMENLLYYILKESKIKNKAFMEYQWMVWHVDVFWIILILYSQIKSLAHNRITKIVLVPNFSRKGPT